MKFKSSDTSVNLAANLIIMFLTVYGLYLLKDVLVPILFAGLLSFLLLAPVSWLERRKFPRALAILMVILLVFGVLFLIGYFIVGQVKSMEKIWPQMVDKGEEWIASLQLFLHDRFNIGEHTQITEGKKYLTDLLKNSGSFLSATLSTTSGFLANFSLIPLYVFLMLLYRDFLQSFLYRLFKKISRHRIDITLEKIKMVMQNYMTGLLLVILIVGVLNTSSLLLLGIPNAVFFGFLAAVLVLIPYFGVAIGALLPILMALVTKDSGWYALGVAISFAVVQILEGNFITPYIVGSKVSINSLAAIISLILFGNLWGFAGLVLALPTTAIIKVICDSVEKLKPWGFLIGDAVADKKN